VLIANLTTNFGNHSVLVRGIKDIGGFLKMRETCLNGMAAKDWMEADAGEILARVFSINLRDEVSLTVGERRIKVRVVGVFRSQTQCDAELIVPLETANTLAGDNATLSLIEFC